MSETEREIRAVLELVNTLRAFEPEHAEQLVRTALVMLGTALVTVYVPYRDPPEKKGRAT